MRLFSTACRVEHRITMLPSFVAPVPVIARLVSSDNDQLVPDKAEPVLKKPGRDP